VILAIGAGVVEPPRLKLFVGFEGVLPPKLKPVLAGAAGVDPKPKPVVAGAAVCPNANPVEAAGVVVAGVVAPKLKPPALAAGVAPNAVDPKPAVAVVAVVAGAPKLNPPVAGVVAAGVAPNPNVLVAGVVVAPNAFVVAGAPNRFVVAGAPPQVRSEHRQLQICLEPLQQQMHLEQRRPQQPTRLGLALHQQQRRQLRADSTSVPRQPQPLLPQQVLGRLRLEQHRQRVQVASTLALPLLPLPHRQLPLDSRSDKPLRPQQRALVLGLLLRHQRAQVLTLEEVRLRILQITSVLEVPPHPHQLLISQFRTKSSVSTTTLIKSI
jgi:hypothetical protein